MSTDLTEEQDGPSLGIIDGAPCFAMPDGTVRATKAPALFDTEGGLLGYADNWQEVFDGLFASEEERYAAAQAAIEEYGLSDTPEGEPSIWLLIAMTLED
jgi:hypothetical protein